MGIWVDGCNEGTPEKDGSLLSSYAHLIGVGSEFGVGSAPDKTTEAWVFLFGSGVLFSLPLAWVLRRGAWLPLPLAWGSDVGFKNWNQIHVYVCVCVYIYI